MSLLQTISSSRICGELRLVVSIIMFLKFVCACKCVYAEDGLISAELRDSFARASYLEMDRDLESSNVQYFAESISKGEVNVAGFQEKDNKIEMSAFSWFESSEYAFEPLVRYSTKSSDLFMDIECPAEVVGSSGGFLHDFRSVSMFTLLRLNKNTAVDDFNGLSREFDAMIACSLRSSKPTRFKDYEIGFFVDVFKYSLGSYSAEFDQWLLDLEKVLRKSGYPYPNSISLIDGLKVLGDRNQWDPKKFMPSLVNSALGANVWLVPEPFKELDSNKIASVIQLANLKEVIELDLPELAELTELKSIHKVGVNGLTYAFLAYNAGRFSNLQYLLDKGANPDVVISDDIYPVAENIGPGVKSPMFSPRKGDTMLLSASLDPFRKSLYIPLILKYTKKPDVRDLLNRNALHRFMYHRVPDEQRELLKLLIDAGVDVNGKSVSGNTPCHVAANRNARLIPELVAAGADLSLRNKHGLTPIDVLELSVKEKWIFHEENAQVLKDLRRKEAVSAR